MSYRDDFPIFSAHPQLAYLDSAATAQKPQVVIDAVSEHYRTHNANIHRGLYSLSVDSTAAYEGARQQVAALIGATSPAEIVFTRGATEALNLLASTLAPSLRAGDQIILSDLEHHANLIPWQQLAEKKNLELRFAKADSDGGVDLVHLATLITEKTRIVSLTHASNVTGRLTPLAAVKKMLQEEGSEAFLIADASQTVAHLPLSVHDLGVDFLVFSGHKLYGPSGIGALWGREALLADLPPYQTGGDMIKTVTRSTATWNDLPWKFEAGTPNIEGAIGLGAAIAYVQQIGMCEVTRHTATLTVYLLETLRAIPQVRLIGTPSPEIGIASFTVEGIHPHDLADSLGQQGICIRAGHHCAAPLHAALGIAATARASIGIYTTQEEIDRLGAGIQETIKDYTNA